MARNNLYHIQDSDRPMWVLAPNWTNALHRWKTLVAAENNEKPDEVKEPNGIALVCEANDLLQ